MHYLRLETFGENTESKFNNLKHLKKMGSREFSIY